MEPTDSTKLADSGAPKPRLHCPYYQYDPKKYGQCNTCNGDGFEAPNRVMEHLLKHHVDPDYPTGTNASDGSGDTSNVLMEKVKIPKALKKKKQDMEGKKPQTGNEQTKNEPGRCRETLPLPEYDRLKPRKRTAKHGSPGPAWIGIYELLFHDKPPRDETLGPPIPFKPYLEQLLYHALHPSPELKAWCEIHHKPISSVEAKLDLIPKIVDWLSETGGFPSGPGTPSPPPCIGLPGGSHSPATIEESAAATQPHLEATNGHDSDCIMKDDDELTGNGDRCARDGDNACFFPDMVNNEWDYSLPCRMD